MDLKDLKSLETKIDKFKLKRIFQRKPYIVWATQVNIAKPYWYEPMRLLIIQLSTATRTF